MPEKSRLSPRKTPLQQRSHQMKEDILNGAIRVLTAYGPIKFTTTRVAHRVRG